MNASSAQPAARFDRAPRPVGGARRPTRRVAEEPLEAVVAGDVPELVRAMAATLPQAGFRATCADQLMEVAACATRRPRRGRHPRPDLIVLVLSREAWTYVSLVEVLVHEIRHVPIVVFTDGAARFTRRLERMGVAVVERLPFDPEGGGVPLTPASTDDAAWGRRVARPRAPTGARRGPGVALAGDRRRAWTPVPAGALLPPDPGEGRG